MTTFWSLFSSTVFVDDALPAWALWEDVPMRVYLLVPRASTGMDISTVEAGDESDEDMISIRKEQKFVHRVTYASSSLSLLLMYCNMGR